MMGNTIYLQQARQSVLRKKREAFLIKAGRLAIIAGVFLVMLAIHFQHRQYRHLEREIVDISHRVSALEHRTAQNFDRLNLLLGTTLEEHMVENLAVR